MGNHVGRCGLVVLFMSGVDQVGAVISPCTTSLRYFVPMFQASGQKGSLSVCMVCIAVLVLEFISCCANQSISSTSYSKRGSAPRSNCVYLVGGWSTWSATGSSWSLPGEMYRIPSAKLSSKGIVLMFPLCDLDILHNGHLFLQ